MSWRLWQYERQPTNYIDNRTIKRLITSVLLSPVNVHDAYLHEVPQPTKKCYEPTTAPIPEPKSTASSFIIVDKKTKIDDKEKQFEEYQDEDENDEDHYLSDDLYDDDDDLYDDDDEEEEEDGEQAEKEKLQAKEESQFIHDFKKTQPRPTTPRRSLLSDLLGRVSSLPPSLLSNSTCSFTTTNSLIEDESSSSSSSSSTTSSASTSTSTTANQNKHNTSKIALNSHPFTNNTNITTNELSEVRWRESFHGW